MKKTLDTQRTVLVTGAGRGIGAATALEVAQAIEWLLSDSSSYVTGTFIDLAGGK